MKDHEKKAAPRRSSYDAARSSLHVSCPHSVLLRRRTYPQRLGPGLPYPYAQDIFMIRGRVRIHACEGISVGRDNTESSAIQGKNAFG